MQVLVAIPGPQVCKRPDLNPNKIQGGSMVRASGLGAPETDVVMTEASSGPKVYKLKPQSTPQSSSQMAAGWDPHGLVWGSVTGGEPNSATEIQPGDCVIAPVGVGDVPAPAYINAFMTLVMQKMVKNLHAPRFDDTAENWPGFMWDFQEYLQKLSRMKPVDDACKLRLFEDAMPATLKGELKLMRKASRGLISYSEVIAKFEARYGSGGTQKLRKSGPKFPWPLLGKSQPVNSASSKSIFWHARMRLRMQPPRKCAAWSCKNCRHS